MQFVVLGVALLASAVIATTAGAAAPDLVTLDVCALVPGDQVAHAVGARLTETRRFNSPDGDIARCVYILALGGGEEAPGRVFAIELQEPSSFTDVRPFVEEPVHGVDGLGDGAWTFRDPDVGRHRLYVLRRDVATLYLTGDDEGELRALAELVLSRL